MRSPTVSGVTLNRLRVGDFRLATAARFTRFLLARLHQSKRRGCRPIAPTSMQATYSAPSRVSQFSFDGPRRRGLVVVGGEPLTRKEASAMDVGKDKLLEMYRSMQKIRLFES